MKLSGSRKSITASAVRCSNADEPKEIQHGRIDKVMAEEKNCQGDEDEEWE